MIKIRKKLPLFYSILITAVLLIAVLTGVLLNVFWDFLYSYETHLPKYVAERVYNEYFLSGSYQKLYDLGIVKLGAFEGKKQFEDQMHSLLDGKELQCYELTTGNPDQKRFRVCTDERKIGDIYLKPSGEQGAWKQTVWAFDRIELVKFETQGVKVKVIHGSTLHLNGVAVSDDYVIESGIQTPSCEHMPEGVEGMTYDIYSVDGLVRVPSVSCVTARGDAAKTYYDKQGAMYVESISYDEAFAEAYTPLAISSLQTYQRYLTRDASRSDVRKYMDEDSDFYKALMRTDTQWYAAHIAHEYMDEAVADFYRYSDEVFSCRYVGTQVITRTKTDVRYFDIDCVLYFRLVGEEYQVYNIVFQ